MTAAIQFRDVRCVRPPALVVLDQVTFTVEPGEFVVLVGRSGSGKTTLLKTVNRLLVPEMGCVMVEGRDTRAWDPYLLRRRVGYVMQEVGLFPHMTVEDNVGVAGRLAGWGRDRVAERVRELLTLVGLPPETYSERWPDELSGGQRQRVAVARALAVDPPVLLMDEPFGALDPVVRRELHQEFRRIHARVHKTVLMVTHDMQEAFELGERIGVIDAGRLIAWDTPRALRASGDSRVRELLAPSLQSVASRSDS